MNYTYDNAGRTITYTYDASTSSYKYTSREDEGTGLIYYRARYYHPRLQRYIAEDPIGFSGGAPIFMLTFVEIQLIPRTHLGYLTHAR